MALIAKKKKKKNSSLNLFISITGNQMFLPTFKSVNRKYSKSQKKINKKIWQSVSQDSYAKEFPFPLKRFENILYIFFKYIHIFSKQLKSWRAQLPFPNGFLLWRSLDRAWRTLKSEHIYLCVPAWKVIWWLEPQQLCCCMRTRQGLLLKWLPWYFWAAKPRSDFCCFIWATKLLFYYLQMKTLQTLTTGRRHCRYTQQHCLTNVVPCVGT